MALRRCPSCGSFNVRRSSYHGTPTMSLFGILSPYRCRDCRTFFRGVSRDLQMGFALMAVIAAVSGSVFFLLFH